MTTSTIMLPYSIKFLFHKRLLQHLSSIIIHFSTNKMQWKYSTLCSVHDFFVFKKYWLYMFLQIQYRYDKNWTSLRNLFRDSYRYKIKITLHQINYFSDLNSKYLFSVQRLQNNITIFRTCIPLIFQVLRCCVKV